MLIKTIKKLRPIDVTLVVGSLPTLNDATLKEAMAVGMGKVATVVENGINGALPGTIFIKMC